MTSGPGLAPDASVVTSLDRSLRAVRARERPIEWPAIDGSPTNDYWHAVRDWLGPAMFSNGAHMEIGAISLNRVGDDVLSIERTPWVRAFESRTELVKRFSWTCSDPATVDFVAAHAGAAVVDPLAGSGWWAALLAHRGIAVTASDLHPPDNSGETAWHQGVDPHHPVERLDAIEALRGDGPDPRTLLLAWPTYNVPLGADVLDAYRGERVIYMGEGDGGCCGDDRMFQVIHSRWDIVAEHRPVQWSGIHDRVWVMDRR